MEFYWKLLRFPAVYWSLRWTDQSRFGKISSRKTRWSWHIIFGARHADETCPRRRPLFGTYRRNGQSRKAARRLEKLASFMFSVKGRSAKMAHASKESGPPKFNKTIPIFSCINLIQVKKCESTAQCLIHRYSSSLFQQAFRRRRHLAASIYGAGLLKLRTSGAF